MCGSTPPGPTAGASLAGSSSHFALCTDLPAQPLQSLFERRQRFGRSVLAAVARTTGICAAGRLRGQARAKAQSLYRGRIENVERNAGITAMLAAGCSRAHIAKIAKRVPR